MPTSSSIRRWTGAYSGSESRPSSRRHWQGASSSTVSPRTLAKQPRKWLTPEMLGSATCRLTVRSSMACLKSQGASTGKATRTIEICGTISETSAISVNQTPDRRRCIGVRNSRPRHDCRHSLPGRNSISRLMQCRSRCVDRHASAANCLTAADIECRLRQRMTIFEKNPPSAEAPGGIFLHL